MAEKKLPNNLSPEVLTRLEKIHGASTPFVSGLNDFNYTLGVPLLAGGFAFLFWDRVPTWFKDDDVLRNFTRFFQTNFRSFSGHADVTSSPASYIAGAVGYNIPLPGDVAAPASEFTTSYLEYTGSPGKAMIEKWFNALHDVNTGASLLGDLNIDFGDPMNWTADVLYIEVRKDFKNKKEDVVEFASYWRGVFPTNIPTIGDRQYSIGQQAGAPVEGQVTWAGVADLSPRVRKYALKVLKEKILNPDSEHYIKFVDTMGADQDTVDKITENDVLAKIYKDLE